MNRKTLVIGDIHGCYDELQALLDLVPLTDDDQIIHIGDLVDRGPYPEKVVDFFRNTPNAHSIMGNRDEKHISAFDGKIGYSDASEITLNQFSSPEAYATAIDYMRTLPLYIELRDAILVHGYYEPNVPIAKQQRDVLLGHMSGEKYLKKKGYKPWYEFVNEKKPIIVGHREYDFTNYWSKVYAIDTRCVYGGELTGLLLPDFKRYQVSARKGYWFGTDDE